MKKLIINADDFGYCREITDGIVQAHVAGCVTSTTLMANMEAWRYAASLVGKYPDLSVGVHLTLTQGYPVLPAEQIPSLVDSGGHFLPYEDMLKKAWRFQISSREIAAELSAQVERLLTAGVRPTHADSHHHITTYPALFAATRKVLKRYGIRRGRTHRSWFYVDRTAADIGPLRRRRLRKLVKDLPKQAYYMAEDAMLRVCCGLRTPDRRFSFLRLVSDHALGWNLDDWRCYLANMPEGINELTCHPGLRHEDPEDTQEWREQRVKELEFLTDPETMKAIRESDVQLVNFNDV